MHAVEYEGKHHQDLLAAVCANVRAMQVVVQHLPVVVFVIDSAGFFRAVAGRPVRHFVHNSKAVIGESLADITNNNPAILANVQRALQGDAFAAVVETRGHIFETRYQPICDARGMIHGVLGMAVSMLKRHSINCANRLPSRRLACLIRSSSRPARQTPSLRHCP